MAAVLAACATTTSPTGRTQYVGAVSQQDSSTSSARRRSPRSRRRSRRATTRARTREVHCVGRAIVTRQLPPGWQAQWETAVFVDDEPNAFALPGGKVGVYTGIFTVARNQDQLAGVIAHEIGHVVSRHHDERITRQHGRAAPLLGIGGAMLGSRYGEGAGERGGAGRRRARADRFFCCRVRASRKARPTSSASS